jgi:hypothetical protein
MADYSHPENRVIHTSIIINAPPDVIYRIITDFSARESTPPHSTANH